MEYLTDMVTKVPEGASSTKVDELRSAETIRAADLASESTSKWSWISCQSNNGSPTGLAITASTNARYENYYENTGTRISIKNSVPYNCIIHKGEVLEYRDSLTQVFRLPNKDIPEFWKGERWKDKYLQTTWQGREEFLN